MAVATEYLDPMAYWRGAKAASDENYANAANWQKYDYAKENQDKANAMFNTALPYAQERASDEMSNLMANREAYGHQSRLQAGMVGLAPAEKASYLAGEVARLKQQYSGADPVLQARVNENMGRFLQQHISDIAQTDPAAAKNLWEQAGNIGMRYDPLIGQREQQRQLAGMYAQAGHGAAWNPATGQFTPGPAGSATAAPMQQQGPAQQGAGTIAGNAPPAAAGSTAAALAAERAVGGGRGFVNPSANDVQGMVQNAPTAQDLWTQQYLAQHPAWYSQLANMFPAFGGAQPAMSQQEYLQTMLPQFPDMAVQPPVAVPPTGTWGWQRPTAVSPYAPTPTAPVSIPSEYPRIGTNPFIR